jgi:hypothetical protein
MFLGLCSGHTQNGQYFFFLFLTKKKKKEREKKRQFRVAKEESKII